MKLLILSTGKPSKYLTQAIEQRGHTYDVFDPRNLYLFISESTSGYDRIFDGSPDHTDPVRLFARSYDGIVSRIGADLSLSVAILRHLNENLGIYSPQTAIGLLTAQDKLWTCQALSYHNVCTPLTVFAIRPNHPAFTIDKAGGLPVVAKQLTGSQGTGVSILETPLSANTTLESFHRANIPVKLQRFIKAATDSGGKATDIRAIVVGDQVVSALERTANGGDFRANLSRGGSGRAITLTANEQSMCIKAAKAVGLDFAGVDLIREYGKAPNFYVTEVNGNPGTGIIDLTGHNHFIDLVAFIEGKTDQPADTASDQPADTASDQSEDTQESESEDTQESESEASTGKYRMLATLARNGTKLSANQHAMLAFYKMKFGSIKWQ